MDRKRLIIDTTEQMAVMYFHSVYGIDISTKEKRMMLPPVWKKLVFDYCMELAYSFQ